MKKKNLIFFALLLFVVFKCSTVYAAGNATLNFSDDTDEATIGEEFSQDIIVSNISGGNVIGVGGWITTDDASCLSYSTMQRIDPNSEFNENKFSYLSLSGTSNTFTIVRVFFTTGTSECNTNINMESPTISFASGTSLTPSTISKAIHVKPAASNDATLKSLSVSGRELDSEFKPDKFYYTVNIPNDVTSANIVAEANDSGATIIGDGLKTDLLVGDNERSVIVSAADGTTEVYVVNLHRINNDASLKSLTAGSYSLSPNFDKDTISYVVNIPNNVTSVAVEGIPTDNSATVTGNQTYSGLLLGDNVKTLEVTAEDGTTKQTYTVNLHRLSNDITIGNLVITNLNDNSNVSYTPTFNNTQLTYSANVGRDVNRVNISLTYTDDGKTVTGVGDKDLAPGDNSFDVTVKSEDEAASRTYTININREAAELTITNLIIKNNSDNSNISYSPAFSDSTTNYSASVGNDVSSINIGFTTNYGAVIIGGGNKTLSEGDNSFDIEIKSSDGLKKKNYTINVHRLSSQLVVSNLKLTNPSDNSNISYSPAFNSSNTTYTATVGTDVNKVNIDFTTNSGAIISGTGTKDLTIGDNSFTVLIKSEDESKSVSYTIKIHKISNVISLTGLQLINLGDNSSISYSPTFNKDQTTYNATVSNVDNVKIKFIASDDTLSISGDGDKTLSIGNNSYTVVVTAEDGTTKKTYTINIRKLSTDANLSGLKIINLGNNSEVTYTPSFNVNTLAYEAEVENNVDRINLKILKSSNSATVTGDGTKDLIIGDNSFNITVTAEDGTTKKIYTVVVTRKEVITSVEFGHTITSDYIMTVANKKTDNSYTTVLDLKNQLDNDNSKLEVWKADGTTKLADSSPVATGMIVKLIVKGKLADSKIIIIKGDVNGDSDVNIIDASAIVNHFLKRVMVSGPYAIAADVNSDEVINIIDASAVVNHFLGRVKIIFKS